MIQRRATTWLGWRLASGLAVLLGGAGPAARSAIAAGLSSDGLAKIAALSHDGVDFETSREAFLDAFPKARPAPAPMGGDAGVFAFMLPGGKAHDGVVLSFYNDSLVELAYVYEAPRVTRHGGAAALVSQTVKKFGPPTSVAPDGSIWDLPEIDRTIRSTFVDGRWLLRVCHRSRYALVPALSRIANVDVFSALTGTGVVDVPKSVMTAIRAAAHADHPADPDTQAYVIGKAVEAYRALLAYRPKGVPTAIVDVLKQRADKDHPADYATQLYVVEDQVKAYLTLATAPTPEGMAQSHLYRLREKAARDHPYDYSTQIYVMDRMIGKYLQARQRGTNGDVITRSLLEGW